MPRDLINLKRWRDARPASMIDRINAQRRVNYAKVSASPKKRRARTKKRNDRHKRKIEVIAAYGGKCTCPGCLVDEPGFLTVEHLGKDGKAHRASGVSVYADIRRRSFPPDYTIHCFNCNIAKSLFGACPHQRAIKCEETSNGQSQAGL